MFQNKTKILLFLLILTLIFSLFTIYISSEGGFQLSARAAVLYEPETESFLYEKNGDERLAMASTTKIMTALVAIECLAPDKVIEIDKRAVGVEGSSAYLSEGELISAYDLIACLMLSSANDAAEALAYEIAGGIEEFAKMMNDRAQSIGLKNTSFKNPHGLDEDGHYTTARDLARLTAEALSNDTFKEISSSYKKVVYSSETARTLVNHNKMLKSYDGCVGVKTGYTKSSGRSLVSAAERDGLTMISVTINAPDDWRDHKKLLDLGYSLLRSDVLAEVGSFSYDIPVLDGLADTARISNREGFKLILPKNDEEIVTHVRLSRYFCAPIREGDILGTVIFTKGGVEVGRIYLTAEENIEKTKRKQSFLK